MPWIIHAAELVPEQNRSLHQWLGKTSTQKPSGSERIGRNRKVASGLAGSSDSFVVGDCTGVADIRPRKMIEGKLES
jgi:hypothetical protein